MKPYTVAYKFYKYDTPRRIVVLADTKAEAYDKACCEKIPNKWKGEFPYSAWVESVTYQNGNERHFNTFEGKPYQKGVDNA